MYFYQIGPQDYNLGMIRLIDVISDKHLDEETKAEVLQLLMKCAYRVAKASGSYWEGDIRSANDLLVFAVPDEVETRYGLLWKQDNNGTTFVASPIVLDHLEENLLCDLI